MRRPIPLMPTIKQGFFIFFHLFFGGLAFFFNKGENVLKNNFQLKNSQAHRTNWINTKFGNLISFFKNIVHISEFLGIVIHGAWQILANN